MLMRSRKDTTNSRNRKPSRWRETFLMTCWSGLSVASTAGKGLRSGAEGAAVGEFNGVSCGPADRGGEAVWWGAPTSPKGSVDAALPDTIASLTRGTEDRCGRN